ncbi:MAG: LAGLIDADG family homing endonuclease [Candidatus Daviesbacteria bacterium]|nr:LAGLIDADG family homing endonuclease [Candidatus Daviesbacteria bacterium]
MRWSGNLAYVVGLITTDGSLSNDGRHIDFTSKDLEQIQNFIKILKLNNKIGLKSSGYSDKKYFRVQFGNIKFYRFLLKIGLTPKKSKTLNKIIIPDRYFRDFLRGHLDGDGYTTSFWDSVYKNSFRLYMGFVSASGAHLEWISNQIKSLYNLHGSLRYSKQACTFQLKYAKNSSIKLIDILYYQSDLPSLTRKRFKIEKALSIIRKQV